MPGFNYSQVNIDIQKLLTVYFTKSTADGVCNQMTATFSKFPTKESIKLGLPHSGVKN